MQTNPTPSTLSVNAATGLILGVRQVFSPHWDARPAHMRPELIVVHGISLPPGEYGGPWIDRLFTGALPPEAHPYFASLAAARVSAHALIRREGQIVQYVSCNERAWHAGVSSWKGRSACNDFSIGIELEGCDTQAYEDAQYGALVALVQGLCASYASLSTQNITGHSDIAPGRKSDPGESFDWQRLRGALRLRGL